MVTIERQDRIAIVRFDRGTRANPMSAALLRERRLDDYLAGYDG